MKRCSFKVAKAIKEAGYPQELKEGTIFYCENGPKDKYDSELYELFDPMYCVCPYVLEVWLWLWRVKKISIELSESFGNVDANMWDNRDNRNPVSLFDIDERHNYTDPEEAIIAAIEYLAENNLIK